MAYLLKTLDVSSPAPEEPNVRQASQSLTTSSSYSQQSYKNWGEMD